MSCPVLVSCECVSWRAAGQGNNPMFVLCAGQDETGQDRTIKHLSFFIVKVVRLLHIIRFINYLLYAFITT